MSGSQTQTTAATSGGVPPWSAFGGRAASASLLEEEDKDNRNDNDDMYYEEEFPLSSPFSSNKGVRRPSAAARPSVTSMDGGGLPRFQTTVSDYTIESISTQALLAKCESMTSYLSESLRGGGSHRLDDSNSTLQGLLIQGEEGSNHNNDHTILLENRHDNLGAGGGIEGIEARTDTQEQHPKAFFNYSCVMALCCAVLTIVLVLVWNHGVLAEAAALPFGNNHDYDNDDDDDDDTDKKKEEKQVLVRAHGATMMLVFSLVTLSMLVSFRLPVAHRQVVPTAAVPAATTAITKAHELIRAMLWILAGLCSVLGAVVLMYYVCLKAWIGNDKDDGDGGGEDHDQHHFQYEQGEQITTSTWIVALTRTTPSTTTTVFMKATITRNDSSLHSIFGWVVLVFLVGHILKVVYLSRVWQQQQQQQQRANTNNRNITLIDAIRRHLKSLVGVKGLVPALTLYVTMALTILLGIQESETAAGCSSYHALQLQEVSTTANNEDRDMMITPSSASFCLQSHTLGMLIFIMAFCTFFALLDICDDDAVASDNHDGRATIPTTDPNTTSGAAAVPMTTSSRRRSTLEGATLLELVHEHDDIISEDDEDADVPGEQGSHPYERIVDEETTL